MPDKRLHYLPYVLAGIMLVEAFSVLHHLYFLEFSLSDLSLRTMVIPALVGALAGLVVARLHLLRRRQEEYLADILARDRLLEHEVRQREDFARREERLQAALAGANDGIWDWDIPTGKIYFSERWLGMLGYEPGDLEPSLEAWKALLHPDEKEEVLAAVEDHIQGRSDQIRKEFRTRRKDGSWEWVLGRGKVVSRDAEGRALRAVGTQTKVTDRKRIQLAMQSLVESTAPATGGDFFQELVKHLAESLGVPFAIVGSMEEAGASFIRPLAVWKDGSHASVPRYALQGSPCQQSMQEGFTVIREQVQKAFPRDRLLVDLGAQGYMGIPLIDGEGRRLGILAVVDRKPLATWGEAIGRSVLPIFAARAAAEILRQRADSALRTEKERAQVTLYSIADGVITTDARGVVEYLNPAAQLITGWEGMDAIGQSIDKVVTLVHETGYIPIRNPVWECLEAGQPIELEHNAMLIRDNGKTVAVEALASPIRGHDHSAVGVVMVFRDVSKAREMARQMTWQATHDPLTSLVNRKEFERQLNEIIMLARTNESEHALLYLDLDQFKVVNDTCGHTAGDELLRQLTFLLKEDVRQSDTLARLGGDEFGLMLVGCSQDQAFDIANKLITTINDFRFTWRGKMFDVGASIGMVPINRDVENLASVLSAADLACYAAKDLGRNRVHIYEPDDEQLARRHGEMHWVSHIKHALAENRFCLYTQRILELKETGDKRNEHHEVMVRMIDENGEKVGPQSFIPAAERYNLMSEIDQWVVVETISCISTGKAVPGASYAINLSGTSFGNVQLLALIRETLERYPIDPGRICFEVTETAAIANLAQAVEFMRELRGLGFRFALDDFGSGLSSFAYLKNLPVDYLKIDGSFVKDMVEDPIDCAMVRAINEIGHTMGIKTIAECVENEETLKLLREIGVDFAQGYHIETPGAIGKLQGVSSKCVG